MFTNWIKALFSEALVPKRQTPPMALQELGERALMSVTMMAPPTAPAALVAPAVVTPSISAAFVKSTGLATMRGANFFTGTGLSDAFLDKMKSEGVKSLRWQVLPFGDTLKQPDSDAYHNSLKTYDGYMNWIREQIADLKQQLPRLQSRGIKVVINIHVGPLMDPRAWGNTMLPGDAKDMPSQKVAMQNLFVRGPAGQQARTAFYDAWDAFSNAFKGDRRVSGYDLLNEPEAPDNPAVSYNALMKETARRIRDNNDGKRLVVESLGGIPTKFKSLVTIKDRNGRNDANVEYAFHLYGHLPGGGFRSAANVAAEMNNVRNWQKTQNRTGRVDISIGELGSGDDRTDPSLVGPACQYLKAVINTARPYGWGWSYFEFHGDTNGGINGFLDFLKPAYRGRALS